MPATVSNSTYDDVLAALGYVDLASPSKVSLYAATFADKDAIADCIADYNKTVSDEQEITYTDYVALLMSSITTISNATDRIENPTISAIGSMGRLYNILFSIFCFLSFRLCLCFSFDLLHS